MFLFKVLILLFCSHVTALGYMILSSAMILNIFLNRAIAHVRMHAHQARSAVRYAVLCTKMINGDRVTSARLRKQISAATKM